MPPLPVRLTKSGAFVLLMLLSGAMLLAPPGWTDWMKGITQLLVPAQAVVYEAGTWTTKSLADVRRDMHGGPPTTQPGAAELERELLFQSGFLDQLRRENAGLRGLREKYVTSSVRLIPASVVARDLVAARDSALVSRGASRGVKWQDWVISRFFVDAGGHEGVERGFSVLAREAVVGKIEFVQPYMARVVLLSDPDCRTAVRVGRIRGGRFVSVDYPATLRGRGRGEMVIEDVPQRYVSTAGQPNTDDQIAIGDLVVTAPDTPGLSAPMSIGRVAAINSDPKKRLVYAVIVEPAAKPDDLTDVYIVAGLPGRDDLLGAGGP